MFPETPKVFPETPKGFRETPKGFRETPKGVRETPKGFWGTSKGARESPGADGNFRFGSGFCRPKNRCRKVLSGGSGGPTVALSVAVKVGSTRWSVFTKQTMALA